MTKKGSYNPQSIKLLRFTTLIISNHEDKTGVKSVY